MANFRGTQGADAIQGTTGKDVINGGAGNDLLVGDWFLFNPPNMASAVIDNDVIHGGAGNDIIVGDIQVYSGLLDSYADLSHPYVPTWTAGNTGLYGDDGNDMIFGVYQEGTFTASNITLDFGPQPALSPQADPHPIEFLFGGNGNDLLVANAGIGTNILDNGAYIMNMFVEHLSGHLDGGNGNDLLNGGCLISNIKALDGSTGVNITLNFESGEFIGGNGADTIYGSDQIYNIIALNDSHFINLKTVFGGDVMDGGNDNDFICGDVGTLKINIDSTSSLTGVISAGGDNIDGGNGNDVIYGDFGAFDLTGVTLAQVNGMITVSQGDTIDGGNGNDLIAGQFGNDILTGGLGSDTFAYFSQLDNGQDVIKDFNVKRDVLRGDHGGMFTDGGHDINGNVVVKVLDIAGLHSNITLVGVTDFAVVHVVIV